MARRSYDYDGVINNLRGFPSGYERFLEKSNDCIDIDELIHITRDMPITLAPDIGDFEQVGKGIKFVTRVQFRLGDLFAPHIFSSFLHNIYLLDYIEDIYTARKYPNSQFNGVSVSEYPFAVPMTEMGCLYNFNSDDFNPDTYVVGGIFGSKLNTHYYTKAKSLRSKNFAISRQIPCIRNLTT